MINLNPKSKSSRLDWPNLIGLALILKCSSDPRELFHIRRAYFGTVCIPGFFFFYYKCFIPYYTYICNYYGDSTLNNENETDGGKLSSVLLLLASLPSGFLNFPKASSKHLTKYFRHSS